jgi:hypothetical protein
MKPALQTKTTQTDDGEYFTPQAIAALWHVSVDTIVRIFEREAVVLILETGGIKRRYRTIRIPAAVLERVRTRLTSRGGS